MAFRIVMIENDVDMKIKLENVVIKRDEQDIWIPLDDISMLVFDNMSSSISLRTLTELANHNIGLIVCNAEHLPIGFYSSYDNHSRSSKIIGFQIEVDKAWTDKVWKEIVYNKIYNQMRVLNLLSKESSIIEMVRTMAEEITDGDKSNREAHAAKVYFNCLMNSSFSRGNEDILLNSGLDYGYSVIRSYIARLCVGYGLNSQIGLHHHNEFNRFNLVDDLMEPVRPLLDIYAYKLLENESYFTLEHRHKLVNFLNHKIVYQGKKMFINNMLDDYVAQFASLYQGKLEKVAFPNVCDYIGDEEGEI